MLVQEMVKLAGDKPGKPIPVKPDLVHQVTRLLCLPVGSKAYMHVPCTMHIAAWTPGQASAMADEMKYNTELKAWGGGPWPVGYQVPAPMGKSYTLVSR